MPGIPAPLLGLNANEPINGMKPAHAIRLSNWVCRQGGLYVRNGFGVQSLGLGSSPLALMSWPGATQALFATTATGLWNVTSASASYILPLQAGYGNASSAIQTNGGPTTLLFVNGKDGLFAYRGATWSLMTVTGCDATKWQQIIIHQRRVFAHDGARVWYLDANAIAGPAHPVIMEQHFRNGNVIAGIASIKPSGGIGPDNILAVVTATGELAIYEGDNPKLATNFSGKGVFDVPLPVTRNAFIEHGTTAMLVTRDGILPIPDILQLDRAKKPVGAITNDIQGLWDLAWSQNAAANLGGYAGLNSGSARFDLITVPGNGTFVRPPETGGWSILDGLNATCWLDDSRRLYFGRTDGTVCLYGGQDDAGQPINALMVGAFQALGANRSPARARLTFDRHTGYRPLFKVLTNYREVRLMRGCSTRSDWTGRTATSPCATRDWCPAWKAMTSIC